MLLAEAFRQLMPKDKPLRVLDLCAAPGGKSTLLLDLLPPGSTLVSNEVIRSRFTILEENIWRWGYPNLILTRQDPSAFSPYSGYFDVVLVDAPCSGEGLFRKDPRSAAHWSPDHVEFCAERQKRILSEAAPLLSSGGILMYSTCTYSTAENIENAEWIRSQASLEPLELLFPDDWGITVCARNKTLGYQCYPHLVRGEGFFLSCLKNTSNSVKFHEPRSAAAATRRLPKKVAEMFKPWLNHPDEAHLFEGVGGEVRAIQAWQVETAQIIGAHCRIIKSGLPVGLVKGRDIIPSPALALSPWLCPPTIPRVELSANDALTVLRKDPSDPSLFPKGWSLATFENLGLAWMKGLGNRVNNGYPKAWRLRK